MTNLEVKSLIDSVKDRVAKNNGYPSDILGSSWDYAMMLTHRKKEQVKLYEDLCFELVLLTSSNISK